MPNHENEEILIVDDDPLTRKLLGRVLRESGYRLREAENGRTALELIRSAPPSLLLVDLDMPEMDGATMLKQLRADQVPDIAQIPAIMLTGLDSVESEVSSLEAGADDFVTKPINQAVLQARIETQLRLHSLRQQLQKQNEVLEAWRKNLERDLAAARLTQQSLIPHKPPRLDGWQIAACFRPVIEVGGDIYGWVRMRDGRMLFWIADATGHGAAAALLTALTKLLFTQGTAEHDSPAAILQAVNKGFRSSFGARSFITAMCLALDPDAARGVIAGAGHPPMLIVRQAGKVELVNSTAPPLGVLEQPELPETTVDFERGDTFVLYTDGLFGGADGERARLTPEALAQMFDLSTPTTEALLQRVINQVTPPGNAGLPDDLAAIAVRRLA